MWALVVAEFVVAEGVRRGLDCAPHADERVGPRGDPMVQEWATEPAAFWGRSWRGLGWSWKSGTGTLGTYGGRRLRPG